MEQTDLRVIRTKKLIKDAFFSLIEEQGFEGVTVKQLTERAGINRGTFYELAENTRDFSHEMNRLRIQSTTTKY